MLAGLPTFDLVISRLLLACVVLPSTVRAVDVAAPSLLDVGYSEMYNLEFDRAHASFQAWSAAHPDDALGPTSEAAADLFAEFDRLHVLQSELFLDDERFFDRSQAAPDPVLKARFLSQIQRAEALATRRLAERATDTDALLAKTLDGGLQADYAAMIERRYFAALDDIKRSRKFAEALLAHDPSCYDVYLALGMENYLLSQNPAPVRWFLRLYGAHTSKAAGLANLRLTAEHGHYLGPYARILLAVAALRDQNRRQAAELLRGLAQEFPHNPLYAEELERVELMRKAPTAGVHQDPPARGIDAFLGAHHLTRGDIGHWVIHTGGPKVLDAIESVLELAPRHLEVSWDCLRRFGNISSASILQVLEEVMVNRRPASGTLGVFLAMGPGFCLEALLVRW